MDTIVIGTLQGPHGLSGWEFALLGAAIIGFIVLPIAIIGFIIYRVVVGHNRERAGVTSLREDRGFRDP